MGSLFRFTCKCGYEATVSGGRDYGMMSEVITIACIDCKTLQDAVVRDLTASRGRERKPRCEVNKKHRVAPWTKRNACPRCGKRNGSLECVGIWD